MDVDSPSDEDGVSDEEKSAAVEAAEEGKTCPDCGLKFLMVEAHGLAVHGSPPVDVLRCVFCGLVLEDTDGLVVHLVGAHSGDRRRVCHLCGTEAADHLGLWRHLEGHRATHLYSCPDCRLTAATTLGLAEHHCPAGPSRLPRLRSQARERKSEEAAAAAGGEEAAAAGGEEEEEEAAAGAEQRRFKRGRWAVALGAARRRPVPSRRGTACRLCRIRFESRRSYLDHRLVAHRVLKCPVCGKVLRNRKTLANHLAVQHRPAAYQCRVELRRVGGSHRGEILVDGTRVFRCEDCGRKTSSEWRLEEHRRDRHAGPYECPECGKTMSGLRSLLAHVGRHDAGGRLRCSHCSARFATKSRLLHHLTSAEPPCYLCDARLPCAALYRRHMRDEHLHRCPLCEDRVFTAIETYRAHMTKEHGKKDFTCGVCGMSTTTVYNLKRHQRRLHGMTFKRGKGAVAPEEMQITPRRPGRKRIKKEPTTSEEEEEEEERALEEEATSSEEEATSSEEEETDTGVLEEGERETEEEEAETTALPEEVTVCEVDKTGARGLEQENKEIKVKEE